MKSIERTLGTLVAAVAVVIAPQLAGANARLISVIPVAGGCVSGPHGPAVQAWNIELGETYTLTIDQVTDCANGGTDATINVRLNNSTAGNTDVVATFVAPGVYSFDFTLPANACETLPISYCTTPGQSSSGLGPVGRNDTGAFQAHLRVAEFGAGCSNPLTLTCPVPTELIGWTKIKLSYYR